MQKKEGIKETIQRLPTVKQLTLLWEKTFEQPPKRLRAELMRLRIQELAYGGHSSETNRQLNEISRSLFPKSRSKDEASQRFLALEPESAPRWVRSHTTVPRACLNLGFE
jgi:hypothetical protein